MAQASRLKKKWSELDTVKFVKLYEAEEVLWNDQLQNYKNKDARNAAYNRIIRYMNLDGFTNTNAVNYKINNIRRTYAQEKLKIKKSLETGADHVYVPSLIWFGIADRFLSTVIKSKKTSTLQEEEDDDSDNDHDTSEQMCSGTYTNRKRATTDTESGGNSAKHTRLDIDDIKIDYDNIDMFGQQIVILLKRLPRKLCRELQETYVTLVKTAAKKHEIETSVHVTASTSTASSSTKEVASTIIRPVSYCQIGSNTKRTVKKEKSAIPDDTDRTISIAETTQATQHTVTQLGTPPDQRFISTIETFPKPMAVPIELVGSMDCVKHEVLDPGESSDISAEEQYNEVTGTKMTEFDPSETDIKIEIVETDLIEEAKKRSFSGE